MVNGGIRESGSHRMEIAVLYSQESTAEWLLHYDTGTAWELMDACYVNVIKVCSVA